MQHLKLAFLSVLVVSVFCDDDDDGGNGRSNSRGRSRTKSPVPVNNGNNCNTPNSCSDAHIACDDSNDQCIMHCNAPNSCKGSHLQCSSPDSCLIHCNAPNACRDTVNLNVLNINVGGIDIIGQNYGIWMGDNSQGIIHCNAQNSCRSSSIGCAASACTFHCNQQNSCRGGAITAVDTNEGSIVNCYNQNACASSHLDFRYTQGSVSINCGNDRSCAGANMTCPRDGDCTVLCQGPNSCNNAQLLCPEGGDCKVRCIEPNSCLDLRVCGDVEVECNTVTQCPERTDDCQVGNTCLSGQWRLKFVGQVDANCTSLCNSQLGDLGLCTSLCECVPSTPAPTPLPTPALTFTKVEVIELALGILFGLFDRDTFINLILTLLEAFASNITIHWTCPASACQGGCPELASEKLAAGCDSILSQDSPSRMANVLQNAQDGTVVQFTPVYKENGNINNVQEKLDEEIMQPTAAAEQLQLQRADIVESEVQDKESDDDGLSAGIIALIVILAVLFIAALVALIVFICCCRKSQPKHEPTDKEPVQY